jgi:hypothetical protein
LLGIEVLLHPDYVLELQLCYVSSVSALNSVTVPCHKASFSSSPICSSCWLRIQNFFNELTQENTYPAHEHQEWVWAAMLNTFLHCMMQPPPKLTNTN